VPSHFSEVAQASQRDVELVFGGEDARKFFIGTPLDMETKICLDLAELVKRSNGIFGKAAPARLSSPACFLLGCCRKELRSTWFSICIVNMGGGPQ